MLVPGDAGKLPGTNSKESKDPVGQTLNLFACEISKYIERISVSVDMLQLGSFAIAR